MRQSPDSTQPQDQWSIDEIEQYILKLCVELGLKNRKIQVETLYIKTRRALNIPRPRIESAIDNLIRAKKIVPNKFRYKINVLTNETRQRIFNAIMAVPSMLANDLRVELGIGSKMLLWHLKMLLDFGLIKQVSLGSKCLFAQCSTNDKDAIIFHILVKNTSMQIILQSLENKQISQSTLLELTPAKRTTLLYHITKLTELGILNQLEEAYDKKYQISPDYKENVKNILEQFFPAIFN